MRKYNLYILLLVFACTQKQGNNNEAVITPVEKDMKSEVVEKGETTAKSNSWANVDVAKVDVEGYYPQFLPDESGMIYSSQNYKGLWVMDFVSGESRLLTDQKGAGYQPVIDDNQVIYQVKSRLKHIESIHLNTGEQLTIDKSQERLSPRAFVEQSAAVKIALAADLMSLELTKAGAITSLKPQGEKNYLAVSLSPSKDKILYKTVGLGAFVSDLNGNTIIELGDVDQTNWLSDSEIVYVQSIDDGMQTMSTQVYVYNLDTKAEFAVSAAIPVSVANPQANVLGNKLVVNSLQGEIYIINRK